jgi:transcriptional regulator with XRE-family HTH domain
MAEKIGMDRSFIADLERGKRNITILNLDVLAQGFGISLSQLLSRI